MICPNPNCKSVIPDDSKFCPDCGTPIKNEEELRRKAKEIVTMYPNGYDYFVKYQSFPHFAYNLTAENCERIIAKKQEIIKKHNEILQEEKRKREAKELEDKRHEVSQIQGTYSKGYYYYAQQNVIPYYGRLSSADCDRVIANKYKIIQKHNEIIAEDEKRRQEKEEELLRIKAKEIRQQCKGLHPSVKPLMLFMFSLGAVALFAFLIKDDEARGYDALLHVVPLFIIAIPGAIGLTKAMALMFDERPIDKEKIRKYKEVHPNDPVCKYL